MRGYSVGEVLLHIFFHNIILKRYYLYEASIISNYEESMNDIDVYFVIERRKSIKDTITTTLTLKFYLPGILIRCFFITVSKLIFLVYINNISQ